MWILDFLKKRSLSFQMNAVLLASGFSVGYTKCHFLPVHPDWYGYLACFFLGYVVSVLVAIFAGALSAHLLGLDVKRDREMLMIIAGMTLIIASLMLLIGSLSYFPNDID